MDISSLTNSVTAILGLSIHGRIPVAVIKNNSVCSCKVHAYTPTSSWKDEAENAFVCIEPFHQGLEEKEKEMFFRDTKKAQDLSTAPLEAIGFRKKDLVEDA